MRELGCLSKQLTFAYLSSISLFHLQNNFACFLSGRKVGYFGLVWKVLTILNGRTGVHIEKLTFAHFSSIYITVSSANFFTVSEWKESWLFWFGSIIDNTE